jgi:hypothetical protein
MPSFLNRLWESNEILAAVITVAISALLTLVGRVFTPRGRVKWAVTHQYTFLTHPSPPPTPSQQAAPQSTQVTAPPQTLLVLTRTIWVQNVGRAPVSEVETILNYQPHHFEIWPQRQYAQANNPAGNLIIRLGNLNPGEYVTIAMLNVGADLPFVTSVRWNGGVAREVTVAPQEKLPRWRVMLLWALILSGVVAWLYLIIRLILLLIS